MNSWFNRPLDMAALVLWCERVDCQAERVLMWVCVALGGVVIVAQGAMALAR